jgi:hypothetical protein
MPVPSEIPGKLRRAGVPLPGLEEDQGAWPKAEALAVIDAIKGTLVVVSDVAVYLPGPWGHAHSGLSWSGKRSRGEADTDYARRMREEAHEFVNGYDDTAGQALFVMRFATDKDAA